MPDFQSMVHLNGHPLCAIDLETTGLIPGYHEIIQIAIIPLDNKLNPVSPHLDMVLRPEKPENIDDAAMRKNKAQIAEVLEVGIPQEKGFDLFEHWYQTLKIGEKKRITPLGKNYTFDRDFLIAWMGWHNYNHYFDSRYRDLQTSVCYLNDRSDFQAEQTPFPGAITLTRIANYLDIEVDEGNVHDAVYDALLTSRCYKKMLKDFYGNLNQL